MENPLLCVPVSFYQENWRPETHVLNYGNERFLRHIIIVRSPTTLWGFLGERPPSRKARVRSAGTRYHHPTQYEIRGVKSTHHIGPPQKGHLDRRGRGGSPGRLADKHARFHNMCIQQLNKLCLTTSVHSDFLEVENKKRLQAKFSRHVPPKLDTDLQKKQSQNIHPS